MSMTTLTIESRRTLLLTRAADYVELTKPRIGMLVLVTVAVAAFVASWGAPDPALLVSTLAGTALVAASASALNQWLERESDALMERTLDRPLPTGRLSSFEVLLFGAVTVAAGSLCLALAVNLPTALLGLLTWFSYVWVYTPLKSRTSANTMVGAIAGALPILMGCASVDRLPLEFGDVDAVKAAMLFLVLFLWQFPHFMAIAWIYREQYGAAGLKMLPVVDPSGRRAGAQALLAALALIPISLIPLSLRVAGPMYFVCAMGLGASYVAHSVTFCVRRDEDSARGLLRSSLIYLPALMGLLVLLTVFPGF